MRPFACLIIAAATLTLAACDRSDPPSDRMAEAVGEAVEQVGETGATPSTAQYAPRDECGEIEGAKEFRDRLAEAVKARDADELVALATDDVLLDYGGGAGKALLRERLADAEYGLWRELRQLVALGCAPSADEGITLPWYFAQDMGEVDPYGTSIALGAKVPLYVGGEGDGVLRYLDWELVESAAYTEGTAEKPGARLEVILPDGQRGFVEKDSIRSLIDYRMLAGPTANGWRIKVLIAGD